jgi:hypothetical protein
MTWLLPTSGPLFVERAGNGSARSQVAAGAPPGDGELLPLNAPVGDEVPDQVPVQVTGVSPTQLPLTGAR